MLLLTHEKKLVFPGETLRSYYTSIEQYVLGLKEKEPVSRNKLDVSFFNRERIRSFLMYLEEEQEISVSTRNLRRAEIVAYLAFASEVCPVYTNAYLEAKKIKIKKAPKPKKDFLVIEEYKAMLEFIDVSKNNGFNHYLLITHNV